MDDDDLLGNGNANEKSNEIPKEGSYNSFSVSLVSFLVPLNNLLINT